MSRVAPAKQSAQRPRVRKDREARYAELLRFAVEACAEKGLARASHADIAAKANVSIPTVFFYFSTREVLIDRVLAEVERFHIGLTHPKFAMDNLSADERLVEMVLACAEGVGSHPAYMRVWLDWSTAIGSDTWPRYKKFVSRAIRVFRGVLEEGQEQKSISKGLDTDDAARIIVGEAHMVAMMMFSGYSRDRIREFVRHLVKGALHFSNS